MKALTGLAIVLFGIYVTFGDAVKKEVNDPDEQHDQDSVPMFKLHESSWNENLDELHPEREHEVEYGFKRGHGHENLRGNFEVDNLECPTMCTLDLKPVCGSDGKTYDNKCLLDTAACKSKFYIYVAKQGRC